MLLTACTQHTVNQKNDAPGSSLSPATPTSPARYFLGIRLTFFIGSNFFYIVASLEFFQRNATYLSC